MKISLALTSLATTALVLCAAASPYSPAKRVLKTRDPVRSLTADGSTIAVATVPTRFNTCAKIVVWKPLRHSSISFKTAVNCQTGSTVNDIAAIALANNRVAWIEAMGGNILELNLKTRTIGAKRSTKIAFATNANGAAEGHPSEKLANLRGDRGLLVYNSWQSCLAIPVGWEGGQSCPEPAPGDEPITILSQQELLKIVNGQGVEIASAPDMQASGLRTMALTVVSADAGRVAIQKPDGSVMIYSPDGDVLQTIPIPLGEFAGITLSGSRLVALRNGTLEVYNVATGQLEKTIPATSKSELRDLQSGLAVLVRGRKVQVLRLSDGKKLTFSPPGKGAVDAQIEASGFYYSYNYAKGKSRGRVVFIPVASLVRRLG